MYKQTNKYITLGCYLRKPLSFSRQHMCQLLKELTLLGRGWLEKLNLLTNDKKEHLTFKYLHTLLSSEPIYRIVSFTSVFHHPDNIPLR